MSKRSDFRKYLISACINTFAGSHLCPMRIRRHILRLFGHQIGTIFPEYFIGIGKGRLKIEDSSFCNYRCFFDMSNDITIGKNCSVAFGVTFVTSTHMIGPSEKRAMGGGKFSNYSRKWMLDRCERCYSPWCHNRTGMCNCSRSSCDKKYAT